MKYSFNMPEGVHTVMNALNGAGYEAYVVGGCVRDMLLSKKPKDWDITTSADPRSVKQIFSRIGIRTFDTGIQHGTVTVRVGSECYEVTTYRIDGHYSDGRRPDEVVFTNQLKEDLLRRDFTINAMAYHPRKGLIDEYGGQDDLKNGLIRCVGAPCDRFREDALRMLRAIRFSAQLGFTIESNTYEAIRILHPLIVNISWERIRDEMNKILISPHPEMIRLMADTGLMQHILPEWEPCIRTEQHTPYHIYNVAEHTIQTLCHIDPEPCLRWTMLLHDIGKPLSLRTDEKGIDHFYGHVEKGCVMADQIMRRLKFDNASRTHILRLIRFHETRPKDDEKILRHELYEMGADLYPELMKVIAADAYGKNPELLSMNLAQISRSEAAYARIIERHDPLSISELAVNGEDLKNLGYPTGRVIGRTLQLLMDQVLDEPEFNQRDLLLKTAGELKKQTDITHIIG